MIGGIGRIEGPLIGTLVYWLIDHYFSDYGTWYLMGLGALAILMTLYVPGGITGLAHRLTGLDVLSTRRVLKSVG